MKITEIKRSEKANAVLITYENGNTGVIFSSIGFGHDLSTPQLVALFEKPEYDTNGFNCESYTLVARRAEKVAEVDGDADWVVEYTA